MDLNQVIAEIETLIKPYVGKMPQSTFSNTMRAIKAGTCKPSTMNEFLARFGYVKTIEKWEKQ